jgi:F0F1-type ATP synthase assembly protein I
MAKKPKKPVDDPKSKKAKAKAKQREEEEDEEEEEDDEPDAEPSGKQKPKSGVYVGLGAITLVALITAGVFFYLDAEAHTKPAPVVSVDVIGLNATAPKVAQ